ncbi:hypothetical protein MMC10_005854 [Thelotrema lepadinum]|nr:hypothetical protein [Thelotrema lepadinum]
MSGKASSSKSPSTFPQEFEESLNRELVIASLEDPQSSGARSAGGEHFANTSEAFPAGEEQIANTLEALPIEGERSTLTFARGLQVPSRKKSPASGFEYPIALEKLEISKEDWDRFSNEVRSHASMTKKQWRKTIGTATGTIFVGALMVGVLSAVPGVIVGQKMRDKREKMNFKAASESGALLECIERWNRGFFFKRGLAVRVDVPGSASDMARMDLSTSKEFRERSETASMSTQSSSLGSWSGYSDSLVQEGRARLKAERRGRIVLMPLDSAASTTTDSEQVILLPEEQEAGASEE